MKNGKIINTKTGKQIDKAFFRNYNDLTKDSKLAKQEANDCVVLSLMIALDIPYEKAHEIAQFKLNRKDRQGTRLPMYAKNIIGKRINGYQIKFIGAHPGKKLWQTSIAGTVNKKILKNAHQKNSNTGYTLRSFIEHNPVGRFMLIVQGHMVAVIDGVLYGNGVDRFQGVQRRVWAAFEMKK
jgi:hypothetical protein